MPQVDIVSGFLGSGKTTLIRKLMAALPEGRRTVIIENEFGDIGIDGEILRRDGYEMVEITAGCICCLMRKDFVKTLAKIVDDTMPDLIIIEPTGISILSDIVAVFRSPEFKDRCDLHSLITVVDCENYLDQRDAFGEFFIDQITNATHLILSKSQLVDDATVEQVVLSVRSLNSTAPLIAKDWDRLSIDELAECADGEVRLEEDRVMTEPEKRGCRDSQFSTFAAELPDGISLTQVRERLETMRGGSLGGSLRGKGFVSCAEGDYTFSFTNGRYEIEESDNDLSGRVCFIGIDFDEDALARLWGAAK